MDISRKKVLIIPFEVLIQDSFISKDILDKINTMNIHHVAIIVNDTQDKFLIARQKSTEFFIFAYCKTAVSLHTRGENMIDGIMALLQHNVRRHDLMVSVGEKIDGIASIDVKDFLS